MVVPQQKVFFVEEKVGYALKVKEESVLTIGDAIKLDLSPELKAELLNFPLDYIVFEDLQTHRLQVAEPTEALLEMCRAQDAAREKLSKYMHELGGECSPPSRGV